MLIVIINAVLLLLFPMLIPIDAINVLLYFSLTISVVDLTVSIISSKQFDACCNTIDGLSQR